MEKLISELDGFRPPTKEELAIIQPILLPRFEQEKHGCYLAMGFFAFSSIPMLSHLLFGNPPIMIAFVEIVCVIGCFLASGYSLYSKTFVQLKEQCVLHGDFSVLDCKIADAYRDTDSECVGHAKILGLYGNVSKNTTELLIEYVHA